MVVQSLARKMGLKGIKCSYIDFYKNFEERLFKRNEICNEDILRLNSPQ